MVKRQNEITILLQNSRRFRATWRKNAWERKEGGKKAPENSKGKLREQQRRTYLDKQRRRKKGKKRKE